MIVSSKDQEEENKIATPEQKPIEKNNLDWLTNREEEEFLQLRPNSLKDYIGQDKLRKQLSLILESSKIRDRLPEHLLFYGQPGLGKTTIASLISREIQANFKVIAAPSLQRVGDLVSILVNIEPKTVLFIDEIHRLRAPLEETLYGAMENFQVDLVMGKATTAKAVRIDLPPITIVGATTQLGKLSKPLKDRFTNVFHLQAYNPSEILELIDRNSVVLKIKLDEESKMLICQRCRGVPRVTNNLLKRIRDYQLVHKIKVINKAKTEEILDELGIYKNGLTLADLNYLRSLENGANGLKTLSAILMEESATVETVIEPYLLHLGFIDKAIEGRKLTYKGREFLNKIDGKIGSVSLLDS